VDGIEEYTVEYIPARGCTEFSLVCDEGTMLQESIFFAFAKAGFPIIHMAAARMTLEDIFLKLTTTQLEEEIEEYEEDSPIDQNDIENADPEEDNEQ
jgi:ABC-2 type transport system ATP-binding protein